MAPLQGNIVQILVQWWCPAASSKALDLLYWVMCTPLHRHITMAIKRTNKVLYFLMKLMEQFDAICYVHLLIEASI
jgi:hypothetical protein